MEPVEATIHDLRSRLGDLRVLLQLTVYLRSQYGDWLNKDLKRWWTLNRLADDRSEGVIASYR